MPPPGWLPTFTPPTSTCPSYKASREEGPHCSQRRPKMKTALLLLVALAVAAGPARALRCHVCSSSSNCENAQNCPASARYCRTSTKMEPLMGNLVEKACVESCTPMHSLPGQVSSGAATTLCCQDDLCNRSLQSRAPARTPLPSTALGLALALGLLALLVAPSL
ncbi:lymphocyte antigen 6D isoform X1 [Callorhinus ursinus]|uniref:Lymphocyte antigen 6D isoform X1 n=2 Tax=Callorhinus ursinus TaxID=34884 RepID=A0A3Q7P9V9_CALUR|nr:lymphocyte antigen 6D isoform X1 [Callorhinus ursinus]